MWTRIKNKIYVLFLGGLILLLSLWMWCRPASEYSDSERRPLAAYPSLTKENVLSGKFMSAFETASLDQFPMRDTLRSLKSFASLYLFRLSEVNELYLYDGYIAKAEYPLLENMLENAGKKFRYLYDTYLSGKDMKLYFSIIPDKNYYLGAPAGQLTMDYAAFASSMKEKTEYMTYIDLFSVLDQENYYLTDTHWKQETLLPAALSIANAMGAQISTDYTVYSVASPFYGVYYGQLALKTEADTLKYLRNDILDACIVTSYNTGAPKEALLYDLSKAGGKDPYELFVCGSDALVTIENPNAETDKELIIFRDSFASSLAPLLASGYRRITLVDIRYISSALLDRFIEFNGQDVLFLYSTLVLNSSTSFK